MKYLLLILILLPINAVFAEEPHTCFEDSMIVMSLYAENADPNTFIAYTGGNGLQWDIVEDCTFHFLGNASTRCWVATLIVGDGDIVKIGEYKIINVTFRATSGHQTSTISEKIKFINVPRLKLKLGRLVIDDDVVHETIEAAPIEESTP